MVWEQIEATPPHLTYLLLAAFLLPYTLFARLVRNRLHLSEPPLALITGIILGPVALGWLNPNSCGAGGCRGRPKDNAEDGWGWGDDVLLEVTRVILSIQVFTIGVGLPKSYASRHWKSVAMLLGPIMAFGWLISAAFIVLVFQADFVTALTIAACLTPTDPVLAASILSNSQFSSRVPKRIKDLLSAESGVNDGISYPFLYAGLFAITQTSAGEALKEYFLITVLWQVTFGVFIGLVIGTVFNRILRFAEGRDYVEDSGFVVFYLLAAVFCVGVGSVLGTDDFLVAFGAGYGFARDGWFTQKIKKAHLPHIIDLILNSSLFIYLGTIIPWGAFSPRDITPSITPARLVLYTVLVLLFRRIPVVLALKPWIPDIKTWREAWFCGHFGPIGLGGLFLAIEGRAILETGTGSVLPQPPDYKRPFTQRAKATEMIWPIVCFVVMSSTFVHGFSVLALSISSHFRRKESERAPLLAGETEPLDGMIHEGGDGGSEPDAETDDSE